MNICQTAINIQEKKQNIVFTLSVMPGITLKVS